MRLIHTQIYYSQLYKPIFDIGNTYPVGYIPGFVEQEVITFFTVLICA